MKIGLMIEGQEGLTWERWFALAGQVESLGLDSLWRSDHFFSVMGRTERSSLEAWVSMTALAARTRKIRFGPLVSPMTFRHPALLARMAAAVDVLSQGRLVLGVGAGWNEDEHAAYGITLPPMKERMDRLEEGINVIRALWQGGPVTLDGRYYPLRDAMLAPRPVQRPGPPLLIGGDGEVRLLAIVAKYADEWNSHAATPDAYRAKCAKLEEHCRHVGRDPDQIHRSWMGGVLIASDQRQLAERARWLKSFLTVLTDVPDDQVVATLRAKAWLAGTPEEIANQLGEWSAVGMQRVMLQYYDLNDLDSLALLAQVARDVA
ncbi:MAG: LLM class F420-dependent oxidoreductase [Candidatus Dormibacteraeota bacterium]|nr:LLM class F420-dependent oxidoreductase [Candidatus Dormibacteraeota bacterium]